MIDTWPATTRYGFSGALRCPHLCSVVLSCTRPVSVLPSSSRLNVSTVSVSNAPALRPYASFLAALTSVAEALELFERFLTFSLETHKNSVCSFPGLIHLFYCVFPAQNPSNPPSEPSILVNSCFIQHSSRATFIQRVLHSSTPWRMHPTCRRPCVPGWLRNVGTPLMFLN